jgi:hypothetical protein
MQGIKRSWAACIAAIALPVEHGYQPFLLVVDIGHVIDHSLPSSGCRDQ